MAGSAPNRSAKTFHATDALARNGPKTLAGSHLVDQFQRVETVAERQVHAAGVIRVDQPTFEALHDKGDARSHADGIQAVGITVKVDFQNGEGVENAQVGAAAGNGFIFRPVHEDLRAFYTAR
jgi:hypothetical protein